MGVSEGASPDLFGGDDDFPHDQLHLIPELVAVRRGCHRFVFSEYIAEVFWFAKPCPQGDFGDGKFRFAQQQFGSGQANTRDLCLDRTTEDLFDPSFQCARRSVHAFQYLLHLNPIHGVLPDISDGGGDILVFDR